MLKEYFNNLSKRSKILVIILIVFIILVLLRFIMREDKTDKVGNYLINKGFVKEEDSTLYHKQISDISSEEYQNKVDNKENATYEMLYFNTGNYHFIKDKRSYEDDIEKEFNPTYDYHNETLTYVYRIYIYNTNVIVEGSYNPKTEDFICNSTFASDIDIDRAEGDICASVKYDAQDFYDEVLMLITSSEILNEMKK